MRIRKIGRSHPLFERALADGERERDADKRGERRWMNRAEVVVGEWRKRNGGREEVVGRKETHGGGRDRPGTEESRATHNVKVFCDYFNGQRDENGGT